MKRDLNRLEAEIFDMLVVGGGIHGACVARDASLRGLRVALIDRDDFGAATSHNSLKLIHGGFRYLQHADLRRLRESVGERRYWLWAAPHLTRPLKCVMSLYGHGLRGPEALRVATAAYGLLSVDRNRRLNEAVYLPPGGVISAAECREMIPGVDPEGLSGGVFWYDGQMLDADRLLLECVADAVAHGAVVANHIEAQSFLGDDSRVDGVRALDRLDGSRIDIRASLTVNTCGPWVDTLLQRGLGVRRSGMTGLSKCMNLVTRIAPPDHAFGVRSSRQSDALLGRERRMFFFTPWRNRTVIGTSHLPYRGDPDDCRFTEADIAEFLTEINAAYPHARLTVDDIDYCYGGLTPAEDSDSDRGEVARARRSAVIDHERDHGVAGLLSAVGVKWTTARLVAEKITDAALSRLDLTDPGCRVREVALPGKDAAPPGAGLPQRCESAVRDEMAMRLGDLVFRRLDQSHRGALDGASLRFCAEFMANELGWSDRRKAEEIDSVRHDRWWRG